MTCPMEHVERVGPTFGESIRWNRTTDFALLETRHTPGLRLPAHSHVHPTITLLLEGSFAERMDGGTFECRPLDVVFKPGGLEHANEYFDAGARCFVVEMTAASLATLVVESGPIERPWIGRGAVSAQLFRVYRSGFASADERTLAIQELVVELTQDILQRSSWTASRTAPGWLDRVRALIQSDLRRPPGLSDLAAEAGVHPSHVCRVFRRHYGCTISSYVQRRRIDEAARRLATDPDGDISTVALDVGYYDQSHFTRIFRRVTGDTPGGFRDSFAASSGTTSAE